MRIALARLILCLTACGLLAVAGRAEDKPATAPTLQIPAAGGRIEGGPAGSRWREGSRLVDRVGGFKLAGERATFVSTDGKLKFDCLENLCAERVMRTITDSPDPLQWSVCGVVTECRGTNYLLLTQAVLKSTDNRQRRLP
jgi:hypothetical protein